jgi:hypothetical protein
MDDLIPPQSIPALTPWLCSYDGPDGRYEIVLYGSDADQVLNDNCDVLLGLTVDGKFEGTIDD